MSETLKKQMTLVSDRLDAMEKHVFAGTVRKAIKENDELRQQLTTAQAEIEELRGMVAELEKVVAKSKSALRKHRWCGDCYPENGWPEVNEALACAQRIKAEAEKAGGGE